MAYPSAQPFAPSFTLPVQVAVLQSSVHSPTGFFNVGASTAGPSIVIAPTNVEQVPSVAAPIAAQFGGLSVTDVERHAIGELLIAMCSKDASVEEAAEETMDQLKETQFAPLITTLCELLVDYNQPNPFVRQLAGTVIKLYIANGGQTDDWLAIPAAVQNSCRKLILASLEQQDKTKVQNKPWCVTQQIYDYMCDVFDVDYRTEYPQPDSDDEEGADGRHPAEEEEEEAEEEEVNMQVYNGGEEEDEELEAGEGENGGEVEVDADDGKQVELD